MKRIIETTKETREFIARTLNIDVRTVFRALSFESDNLRAQRIRIIAKQHGGKLIYTLPACETIHDADGLMTQTFPNGAKIIVNKKSGDTDVVYQDKIIKSEKGCSITALNELQQFAAEYKKGE